MATANKNQLIVAETIVQNLMSVFVEIDAANDRFQVRRPFINAAERSILDLNTDLADFLPMTNRSEREIQPGEDFDHPLGFWEVDFELEAGPDLYLVYNNDEILGAYLELEDAVKEERNAKRRKTINPANVWIRGWWNRRTNNHGLPIPQGVIEELGITPQGPAFDLVENAEKLPENVFVDEFGRQWLTMADAGRYVGVRYQQVFERVNRRKIMDVRRIGNANYVPLDQCNEWIDQRDEFFAKRIRRENKS